MFDGPTATIDVVLDAFSGDEGIASVRLLVDDTPVLIDNDMPYGFEGVEIAVGMHTLGRGGVAPMAKSFIGPVNRRVAAAGTLGGRVLAASARGQRAARRLQHTDRRRLRWSSVRVVVRGRRRED
jgi:hypothetical protein